MALVGYPPVLLSPNLSAAAPFDHGIGVGTNSGIEDCCTATLDKIRLAGGAVGAQEQELENKEYFPPGITHIDLVERPVVSESARPFQRWIKTFQKRAMRRQDLLECDGDLTPGFDGSEGRGSTAWESTHRRQSSDSSLRFVAAVKSASISLASVSVLTRSRRNTLRSSRGQSRTDRSSRASVSGARLSEDSVGPERQIILDPAVLERALQRRRILEELISTEESYIGDVRFLMNVSCGLVMLWLRRRCSNSLLGLRHHSRRIAYIAL